MNKSGDPGLAKSVTCLDLFRFISPSVSPWWIYITYEQIEKKIWIKDNVVDFLGVRLKVLNDSNDWKQDIFATSIVLHKVSRAKSYVFGTLLMPYIIVIKNVLLHHVIRNVGQQCCKVSKTEKLREKTMGWKGCWLNSQLTDLLEENKSWWGTTFYMRKSQGRALQKLRLFSWSYWRSA